MRKHRKETSEDNIQAQVAPQSTKSMEPRSFVAFQMVSITEEPALRLPIKKYHSHLSERYLAAVHLAGFHIEK